MLQPLKKRSDEPRTSVISVRLTTSNTEHAEWLMKRLNMTRTELIQALIEQEHEAQSRHDRALADE